MKFLVTGLGNPGPKYENTRHNIGFRVLDELASRKELVFGGTRYGHSCTYRHKGRQIILLKPGTFMNLSGKAIRFHMIQQKINPENLLVITDDLALPLGRLRVRGKGSDGGHNGLANIQEVLGNTNYPRLRFGVGSDFPKGAQVNYVLSDFSSEEEDQLKDLIPRAADIILSFATQGINRTMSEFNN